MKKAFAIFLMCAITSFAFAQNTVNFTIDSEGEFHVPNSEKDYYVFNFPGKSAAQLYNLALKAATRIYNGTDDEIKKVPNQMITITSSFRRNKHTPLANSLYQIFYVYDIEFKAGRIRVNAPRLPKVYVTCDVLDEDEEEHPFSYIRVSSASHMNTWFPPMNESINKLLAAMSNKKDDNW
jgi:hypothetical protein